jgi:hypothetical protein
VTGLAQAGRTDGYTSSCFKKSMSQLTASWKRLGERENATAWSNLPPFGSGQLSIDRG